MTLIKIIYLAILLATGLFVILYVDSLALLWFLVMCFIPVVLFLTLLLARIFTKITVEVPTTQATVNEKINIRFCVKNMSLITLAGAKVRISYRNLYTDFTEKSEFIFPINAMSKKHFNYELCSSHVGVIKLKIKDIILYDFFKLFSIKIKLHKEVNVSFLPKIHPTFIDIRRNEHFNSESNVNTNSQKGDDPSDISNIREFSPGDKLNRIHWKLSSKNETLMVKEYSQPIYNNVLLLLELAAPNNNNELEFLDIITSITASLSWNFCQNKTPHSIAWFDKKHSHFYCKKVINLYDMYSVLSLIISSYSDNERASFKEFKNNKKPYSHVVYLSCEIDKDTFTSFNELPQNIFYTVFDITETKNKRHFYEGQNPQIYTISHDYIADELYDITL